MKQDLKKTWAGKIFTDTQLEKLAKLSQEVSSEEWASYGETWKALVAEVQKHINKDPHGVEGQAYAKRWMDLAQKYYSDRELGEAIWNAYKQDRLPKNEPDVLAIPRDVIEWIDKAVNYMYSGKKK